MARSYKRSKEIYEEMQLVPEDKEQSRNTGRKIKT